MHIEASGRKAGDKAIYKTDLISVTSDYVCLSFWYHMFGSHIGELWVKVIKDHREQLVWGQKGRFMCK